MFPGAESITCKNLRRRIKMPNRYLRESFVESERINSVSVHAELLWVHLLTAVDDFGRCEANIRILRPKIFPLRMDEMTETRIAELIDECEQAKLLLSYEVDGKIYIQLEKWEKGRAEKSRWPSPHTDVCSRKHLFAAASSRKQPQTAANICLQTKTFPPTTTTTTITIPTTISCGQHEPTQAETWNDVTIAPGKPSRAENENTDSLPVFSLSGAEAGTSIAQAPEKPASATEGGKEGHPAEKPKPQKRERPRNPLFDALAEATGENPEIAGGRIGKALSAIVKAMPDVTPEEIQRRARNYTTHFRDAALSSTALASWWARCAEAARARISANGSGPGYTEADREESRRLAIQQGYTY